jgi:hypothetical protein
VNNFIIVERILNKSPQKEIPTTQLLSVTQRKTLPGLLWPKIIATIQVETSGKDEEVTSDSFLRQLSIDVGDEIEFSIP